MNTNTTTAHFKASKEALFSFLSKEENLPAWATGFCQELKTEGDDFKVVTPDGELFFRIDADAATGVIDLVSGPTKDAMIAWPARVTTAPMGGAFFSFTALQMPGVSDAKFAGMCAALKDEFELIRKAVE